MLKTVKKILKSLGVAHKYVPTHPTSSPQAEPTQKEPHDFLNQLESYDGYEREEALNYFSEQGTLHNTLFPSSILLPHILKRLNDWVPQVQKSAHKAFYVIISPMSLADIVKHHKVIEGLAYKKRANLKEYQLFIFQQIQRLENRDGLIAILKKGSYRERLFCWKALTELSCIDRSLLDIGLKDPHPTIRFWSISSIPHDQNFKFKIKSFFNDKSAYVRYAALKAIPQDKLGEYRDILERALFDGAARIRLYARYALRIIGDDSFPDMYREALKRNEKNLKIGAICGLSESGSKNDLKLIESFFKHSNGKVRASALLGLNRLQSHNIDDINLRALSDNNTNVRRKAINILRSRHRYLRADLEKIAKTGSDKAQSAALKVLCHYAKNVTTFWGK